MMPVLHLNQTEIMEALCEYAINRRLIARGCRSIALHAIHKENPDKNGTHEFSAELTPFDCDCGCSCKDHKKD